MCVASLLICVHFNVSFVAPRPPQCHPFNLHTSHVRRAAQHEPARPSRCREIINKVVNFSSIFIVFLKAPLYLLRPENLLLASDRVHLPPIRLNLSVPQPQWRSSKFLNTLCFCFQALNESIYNPSKPGLFRAHVAVSSEVWLRDFDEIMAQQHIGT